jgi:hypothetical protein
MVQLGTPLIATWRQRFSTSRIQTVVDRHHRDIDRRQASENTCGLKEFLLCDTAERHAIDRVSRPSIFGSLRPPTASRLPLMAVTLGVAMPALIFAMTKVGALMWTRTHGRHRFAFV